MAVKVYAKGNYFIIESADGTFKEDHKSKVRVSKRLISDTTYFINMRGNTEQYELADLTDENGNAYTQNSWETFAFANTGFSSASGGSGAGTTISVVSNYSALPSASSHSTEFYWVSNTQGTKWLPGSLGGTFYPNGMYYSNGTDWEYLITPYNATLLEVNNGTNNDKFVTPYTFENASKWNNYLLSTATSESAKKEVVEVINKTGATLTKGTIVYIKSTSSSATYPEVLKASASTEATSSKTIGAIFEDILNDATGFVVTSGEVSNLDTSSYSNGTKLWLSTTAGQVTSTAPTQPNHTVFIGHVTRSQNTNGRILYAIQNGYEIEELHNVLINSVANNDILQYESATSLWKNKVIPTASNTTTGYLTTTDWNSFNSKQSTITLTTNGTSGLSTFVGNTLNIPNYSSSTSLMPQITAHEVFRGVTYANNSTTESTFGGITMSTSASTIARSVASTNYASKQVRKGFYASVVSAGRYSGTRGSALLWYIGGGFRYVCEFYISDTAYGSGCRQFYGMIGQTTDLTYSDTVTVASMINIIGLGSESTDTNLQIFHNDGSGTATKIDLGVNFPANRTAGAGMTNTYSLELFNNSNSTSVIYKVTNNETGNSVEGTITTNLPLDTQGLNFCASRCMGTGITNTGQFDLTLLGVYSL